MHEIGYDPSYEHESEVSFEGDVCDVWMQRANVAQWSRMLSSQFKYANRKSILGQR